MKNMKKHRNQSVSFSFVGCLHLRLNVSRLYALHILLDSPFYLCKSRLKQKQEKHVFFEKGSAKIMQDLSDNDPWNPSNFLIKNMFQPKDADVEKECWRQPGLQPEALQGLPSLTTKKSAFRRNLFLHFHLKNLWFHEKHWHRPALFCPSLSKFFSHICWRLESRRIQLSPPRIEGKLLWKCRENQRQALKVCKIPQVCISPFLVWVLQCDADVNDMEVDAKWCDDPPNCNGFTGFWRPCLRLLRQEASKTYQTLHRIAGGLEAEKEQTANTR